MVFASTVRFTANTAFRVGLLSGYIVSLTGEWLSFFGVLLILVVLVVLARGLHPVSFPNLEVKPFCADGTATGGLWESRALPTVSLSEWTGECWPVCGLVFPGLLFWWWGCLVLFCRGRHPHHFFLLYQPGPGVVVGKEQTTWAFLPMPHPTYLIRLWHGPKRRHQPRAI